MNELELKAIPTQQKQTKISWQKTLKKLKPIDYLGLFSLLLGLSYYALAEFWSFVGIICVFMPFLPLLLYKDKIFSPFKLYFGVALKTWHLVSLAIATSLFFTNNAPAQAFFFKNIEDTIVNTLTASGAGGDTSFVTTLFTIIRIVIVMALIGGIVFAAIQASQGGNLTPVLTAFMLALMVVVSIEGFSKWILVAPGGGGGTTVP